MSLNRLPLPSQASKKRYVATARGFEPWNSGLPAFLAPLLVGRVHSADLLTEYSLGLNRNFNSVPSSDTRLAFISAGPQEAVVGQLEGFGGDLVAAHVECLAGALDAVDGAQAPTGNS